MTTGTLVYDMPEDVYHAHPALSHSGAKMILKCPAKFKHERDHGRPDRKVFDFGHAAHRLVLGAGSDIVAVDAPDWRTKAAKDLRDEIRDKGAVPLLAHEMAVVEGMAEALREHPIANRLLSDGDPEVSAFWTDLRSGVELRARFDWLPYPRDGRLLVADYKTADSADPYVFARAAASYGYPQQAAWYTAALKALDIAPQVAFLFVVQEKTAPYLVSICELDHDDIAAGRARNREAIDTYAHCVEHDEWPGYTDNDIAQIVLPNWYRMDYAS